MARPSKLTPETQATIVRAIRGGAYLAQAAGAAGVAEATFYRWMAEGERQAAGARREFREAVLRAEQEAEQLLVSTWMSAGVGRPAQYDSQGRLVRAEVEPDWRACRDLLARRHPDRWAPKERLELSGTVEHAAVPEPADLVGQARERVLHLVPGSVAS